MAIARYYKYDEQTSGKDGDGRTAYLRLCRSFVGLCSAVLPSPSLFPFLSIAGLVPKTSTYSTFNYKKLTATAQRN